jgi:two-component system sensor histidine kinase/response regulator
MGRTADHAGRNGHAMNMPTTLDTTPIKCLIVDDLEENLLALAALLQRDGVQLLPARSGLEALELLLVHDVALAILDVQMPEMDGFELAETMRSSERTRHIPIIFVTAGLRDAHRMFKGYEAGAVDFLYKPIEPHMLRSKAGVFFQLHRQKMELGRHLQERTETLRLQEMFTAVLGHDLRSPLSALIMSAEVLARRPDPSVSAVGERLLRSGRWMGRMIDDLLDLTRTRAGGGMPVTPARVDLLPLAERVVQERACIVPDKTVQFTTCGDLVGEWDEDRLAQVLSNLLGNALRHGSSPAVQLHIDGNTPQQVRLRVANGGTIPAEIRSQIFDPFRSGRSQASRSEGLGLGLYIVQQIVWAHGGTLLLESGDERTVFIVDLPRRPGRLA